MDKICLSVIHAISEIGKKIGTSEGGMGPFFFRGGGNLANYWKLFCISNMKVNSLLYM